MKLMFKSSNGNERTVANVVDENRALKEINNFCYEHGYVIPYIRTFTDDDGATVYNVGSHVSFFKLYQDNKEQK